MNKLSVIGLGLLLGLVLGVGTRPAAAQGSDPVSVWQVYAAAENRADGAAMGALFADDGTFLDTHPAAGLAGVWHGKAVITEFLKEVYAPGSHMEYSGLVLGAGGNPESLTITTVHEWTPPGINLPPGFPLPIEYGVHLIVHNGQIQTLVVVNTPAWLAQAKAAGDPPGNPPPANLAVWQAYQAAANKGDVAAMAALFAENGALADTHPPRLS